MPIEFLGKGYEGDTVGCAMSCTPLDIRGTWHISGRQPVSKDGAPQWVYNLFHSDPEIEMIAIGRKYGGQVYTR